MKKIILILIIAFSLTLVNDSSVFAKLLPQTKSTGSTSKTRVTGSSVTVYPKLRRDKKALNISIGNLQNATSVEYTVIYKTNQKEEGAIDTIIPQKGVNYTTREILFGTCSAGVCTYHTNVSNLRLEVKSSLKSGKKTIKRYKIRI